MFRVSSKMAKPLLGDVHTGTLVFNSSLGRVLRKQMLLQESEELRMAALGLQINVFGEDYPDTLWTMFELGRNLS